MWCHMCIAMNGDCNAHRSVNDRFPCLSVCGGIYFIFMEKEIKGSNATYVAISFTQS